MSRPRAAVTVLAMLLSGAAAARDLHTVPSLDLDRYMGRWHQIALLPNRFQAGCAGATTADYARREDGRVRVVNRCRGADGDARRAEGVARVDAEYGDPARLEVRFAPAWLSFLPWVWGKYWVIALTADYGAALVGSPDREYLWVLARTPSLARSTYARLVATARAQGFAVERLRLEAPDAVR